MQIILHVLIFWKHAWSYLTLLRNHILHLKKPYFRNITRLWRGMTVKLCSAWVTTIWITPLWVHKSSLMNQSVTQKAKDSPLVCPYWMQSFGKDRCWYNSISAYIDVFPHVFCQSWGEKIGWTIILMHGLDLLYWISDQNTFLRQK